MKSNSFTVVLATALLVMSLFLLLSGVNVELTESVESVEGEIQLVTENPVISQEFQPAYCYTEEELDLLSRLIYAEGGSESYNTQLKIGSVVLNRLDDPNFPNSIKEVIYEPNQFSVTTIKIDGVIMIDLPASEQSKKVAWEVLNYGSILPKEVQVFYRNGCKDKWVTSRETYEVADKTVFAYIHSKGE